MDSIDPAFRRLLAATETSELSRTVRSGLVGLRAMLAATVGDGSADPGADACMDVVIWLDGLLQADGDEHLADAASRSRRSQIGSSAAPSAESAPGQVPQPPQADKSRAGTPPRSLAKRAGPGADRWRALLRTLVQDRHVLARLDQATVDRWRASSDDPAAVPADLWEPVQLLLLRLPESVAGHLRKDLWQISAEPPNADPWRYLSSNGGQDVVLVAPLDGKGAGLTAVRDARPDAQVAESLGEQQDFDGNLPSHVAELAHLCTAVLAVSAFDEDLWLCLESLRYNTAVRLDDGGRERLRRELLARLREYARRAPTSAQAIAALIAVDEALHGVIHLPVAAPGSWWGQQLRRSRALLERQGTAARKAGTDVEIRPLLLDYRQVRSYTSGNDVAVNIGGQPGETLACLRVHAQIGGQEMPGRVLYRASE